MHIALNVVPVDVTGNPMCMCFLLSHNLSLFELQYEYVGVT